jgi:hypothetical protein
MTMTRKWKRAGGGLIAGVAAALMIGASAMPAVAATPTWSVKPGGAIVAKAGKTVLRDTKTGLPLSCTSSTAKTTLKKGHRLSGAGIGSVTSVSFAHCTAPGNLKFTVATSATPKKPWKLNALSYNKKTGVTTGTITGIHANLTGGPCTAVVDGTGASKNNGLVRVTYNNKTHKLIVLATGGNLHIYHPSLGCLGVIKNGDPSAFSATYSVSPATTITSP